MSMFLCVLCVHAVIRSRITCPSNPLTQFVRAYEDGLDTSADELTSPVKSLEMRLVGY